MWKIICAVISSLLYLSYLFLCEQDRCLIGQTIPFIKVGLQGLSVCFCCMAFSYITYKGHLKNAKKGVLSSQLIVANYFFVGKMCNKDLRKSYFWAYVANNSSHLTPKESKEGSNLLKKLDATLSEEEKRQIQHKSQNFIDHFKRKYSNKPMRKHEADLNDIIKSTLILTVLAGAFIAIPKLIMPNSAKISDSPHTDSIAVIRGYTAAICYGKKLSSKECFAPIFEFNGKDGSMIRSIGHEDKNNITRLKTLEFDRIPVAYLNSDPSIVVSKEQLEIYSIINYFFYGLNFLIIISHAYTCCLNYKYRLDDRKNKTKK
jgi:hypothetical protein